MNTLTDALNQLFGSVNSSWGTYLLAVAGLGTLTMAVLQVIKDLTPLRGSFHRSRMQTWLTSHITIVAARTGNVVDSGRAEAELITLSTDGDSEAFFGLEIEKLCGQWNAGLQILLDYPRTYPNIFLCMAARADADDIRLVLVTNLESGGLFQDGTDASKDELERRHSKRELADARTRVFHQMQRAVDAFQITATFRWKWLLQIASFAISLTLVLLAVWLHGGAFSAETVLSAAIAGFLAPVARDLLAAVEKLRE